MAPLLTVIAPGQRVLERGLTSSPFVLGRDPTCEVPLDYPWLSRRHLVLESQGSGWTVRSEGKNVVRLDGAILEGTRRLEPGARIEVGPLTVLFDAAAAPGLMLEDGAIGQATVDMSLKDLALGERQAPQRHLALLGEISAKLATMNDEELAAREAAAVLLEAVGARATSLIELGEGGKKPKVLGLRGVKLSKISRALLDRALRTGSTLALSDARTTPALADRASVLDSGTGPVLVAVLSQPMTGVLYADRAVGATPFNESDAAFATVLAHLVGPAIDAARRSSQGIEARQRLEAQRVELTRDIERRGSFGRLVGASLPMQKLAKVIAKVAGTDTTVLITGETGAGKELVAREIHQRSSRADGPFFAINCAALPETLIESELFGHVKGAFSGADKDRRGIFELGSAGTVFLDEIGELPSAAQAKVLRVLETKEVLPVGAEKTLSVDVRLVAATHRDLAEEVSAGRFRQDLLYRLNVFPIAIPALRSRSEDIPALVEHFLKNNSEARKKELKGPTPAALAALSSYRYPGNVRELAHLLERAAILADDGEAIDLLHLPDDVSTGAPAVELPDEPALSGLDPSGDGAGSSSLRAQLEAFERALIIRELERDGWNRTKTARRLEISLRAFMDKLRRFGIKGPA